MGMAARAAGVPPDDHYEMFVDLSDQQTISRASDGRRPAATLRARVASHSVFLPVPAPISTTSRSCKVQTGVALYARIEIAGGVDILKIRSV
jgi:hypothetical protein